MTVGGEGKERFKDRGRAGDASSASVSQMICGQQGDQEASRVSSACLDPSWSPLVKIKNMRLSSWRGSVVDHDISTTQVFGVCVSVWMHVWMGVPVCSPVRLIVSM